MADAAANAPQIQGNLPLYVKPEPLNAQAHKGKGVKFAEKPFSFLKETHFVPLTLGEFGAAASRFPIIFLGENRLPVAVMGLQQGHNLFVDPETGVFERYSYLPAFVRRYPFVSASHTEQSDRFTVCIDAGSPLFSDKPDQPFFTEDGQPSEFTTRAIEMVRRFESDANVTRQFAEKLTELGLFEQQQTNFTPRDANGQQSGDPRPVASYWGVSGEKLRGLDAKTLAELRDNAYLGGIYAHMLSMNQWDSIVARAGERGHGPRVAANGAAADAPPPPPQA